MSYLKIEWNEKWNLWELKETINLPISWWNDMMHNCSYIVPWHKPQSFFSWQTTIYSSISVFKRWIFGGVFWYRALAAVGCEAHHTLGINIPPTCFFFIFALLQSWTNTWVIMALFLSLVSLFRNNSNNNNNNNNNNNSLKKNYISYVTKLPI